MRPAPLPDEPWRAPVLGACACSHLRRAARAVSNLYDEALVATGLTITQYAVLVTIGRADGISRTALAAELGMERTTLTRNLRPLERERLVRTGAGEDRRERLLHLTAQGRKRLAASYPLWEDVQRRFVTQFGDQQLGQLRDLLTAAIQTASGS